LRDLFLGRVITARSASETVSLELGSAFLLEMDRLLGDGSGSLLQGAGEEIGRRILSETEQLVVVGDLMATVARIRAPLEYPLVGTSLGYDIREAPRGFQLVLSVGRGTAGHAFAHLTAGYLRAAAKACGEPQGALRLAVSRTPPRYTVQAEWTQHSRTEDLRSALRHVSQGREVPPPSHSVPVAFRERETSPGLVGDETERATFEPPLPGGLAAEVDRILARSSRPPAAPANQAKLAGAGPRSERGTPLPYSSRYASAETAAEHVSSRPPPGSSTDRLKQQHLSEDDHPNGTTTPPRTGTEPARGFRRG
jgi:hypothetical protein